MQSRTIFAREYWNDTGVDLQANTRYRISVVPGAGSPLRDASHPARGIAGEDWDSLAHKIADLVHGKRMDDAKWFALIGTIDKAHPWVITDGGVVTAPVTGRLFCYFNDVEWEHLYGNNSGSVVLEIEALDR